MTTTREPDRATAGKLSMAEVLEVFTATGRHPLKFTAYDGSSAGNDDAAVGPGSSIVPRRHLPGDRPRRARPGPRVHLR